ncbi:hypothetical protein [Polaromonas sp.]|jgi:hypothetical protein|uniref:hypothetical protein n=1 Tax=Polaromonas sp. TaxID=1869339 RepID=UPI0037CC3638
MATTEITANWGDYEGIRELLAEQNRLGLALSWEEKSGFLRRKFIITGSPENLAVWDKAFRAWDLKNQAKLAW